MTKTPTIKGMFIKSHINKLRRERGDSALRELEEIYGKPIIFTNFQDVPVREEVRIIEIVLDLLGQAPRDPREHAFEAGRLHFRNFIGTPFGIIVSHALPKTIDGFRRLLLQSRHIARHVFKNTNFSAKIVDGNLSITMENSDYPIDHFRGLFYEWMVQWGISGARVEASEIKPQVYEYRLLPYA